MKLYNKKKVPPDFWSQKHPSPFKEKKKVQTDAHLQNNKIFTCFHK